MLSNCVLLEENKRIPRGIISQEKHVLKKIDHLYNAKARWTISQLGALKIKQ